MTKTLHPSIVEFKEFVKRHPKLVQEVRGGHKQWQEVYENWVLLGENDSIWKPYVEEGSKQTQEEAENKAAFLSSMMNAIKNMDANQMNHHIHQVSNTITTFQNLLSQFGIGQGTTPKSGSQSSHPFSFRKD
ncbi:YlbD family protein [Metabacillus arenae]|uniref:YlbD family protein n=1 Tax=Metabacillus arenae TaxID=2771434 RepID=A0A926S1F4_9BACI|nr:YlbD family protein [Metabacillus arenae]MBD1380959.1 YlbD family protein [Metabacillus arenae]